MTEGSFIPSQLTFLKDSLVQVVSRLISCQAFTHMTLSGRTTSSSFRLGDLSHALNEPMVLPQQIWREQIRAIGLGEMWKVVDLCEVEHGGTSRQVRAVKALDHSGDNQLLLLY